MNRTFVEFEDEDIKVDDGFYRSPETQDGASEGVTIRLRHVDYGRLDNDTQEVAVIVIETGLGGASLWLDVSVFNIMDGRPALLGQIEGGDRAEGGIAAAHVEDGYIIVHRLDGDTLCCPDRVVIERWSWLDGEFIKMADLGIEE